MKKNKIYVDYENFFQNDNDTKKYYKTNKIMYRIFHSKNGFMHMKVANNEGIKDILYQPQTVLNKINSNTERILELGCGQCSNLKFLAPKNKDISFTGIDLTPGTCKQKNVEVLKMDYHDLSKFENNSFDIVYAIETLCYSTNKQKIFNEVYRILKKDGLFIIFDGYTATDKKNISKEDLAIMATVEKGMALEKFEEYKFIKKYATKSGFTVEEEPDLSRNILPNMNRFNKMAKIVLESRRLSKLIFKMFSKEFTGNILAGYFMSETIEKKLFNYYLNIFKK